MSRPLPIRPIRESFWWCIAVGMTLVASVVLLKLTWSFLPVFVLLSLGGPVVISARRVHEPGIWMLARLCWPCFTCRRRLLGTIGETIGRSSDGSDADPGW